VRGTLDPRMSRHYWHGPNPGAAQWKTTEAIQLRDRINEHYLSDAVHQLKTRTLHSLIDEIHDQQQKAS
jgi:hypothetical protein